MENDHSEKVNYSFLVHRKIRDVFGKIDYLLRSSVHIQRAYPKQEELFRFIEDNYESMASYYSDLFKLNIDKGGSDMATMYYFMDYEADSNRSAIPAGDHRYKKYLETSHIGIIDKIDQMEFKYQFYYSGDWDCASLGIYSRIKKKLAAYGKAIVLLTPDNLENRLPVDSPHHYSKWDFSKPFSGLNVSDFNKDEIRLIQ